MQLQKADLEGLLYTWLARKAYGAMRFGWCMFRRPKARGFLIFSLYITWQTFVVRILTELRRTGRMSDPATLQKWKAYVARVSANIDRRCEQVKAMQEGK